MNGTADSRSGDNREPQNAPSSSLHPIVRRFRVRYEMRWAGLNFRGRRDEYTVTMTARWPSEIRRRWSSSHPGTTLLEVNPANEKLRDDDEQAALGPEH